MDFADVSPSEDFMEQFNRYIANLANDTINK